ncbi:MAG: chemotaxis protein CheA [Spirochaetales bacterium]|uniref:Chemotaxis protein CheA n=1 Tax=Candidatus Thalassospirochaeta sargassi TaxID=3119039 RepID=A0AAJ1MNA1_9SPIO|nr:chemotaxis protein CheA [Spirochaetales bacterium]
MNSDQFRQAFIEESTELLSSLEAKLLEMEEAPEDKEKISAVFRIIHTIKGSSAMFGFNEISEFTHHVENILDAVREKKISVSRDLIDWTLRSGDHITALIEADEIVDKKMLLAGQSAGIVNAFREAVGMEGAPLPENTVEQSHPDEQGLTDKLWRIKFKPADNIFLSGTNPLLLLDELGEFGDSLFLPHIEDVPDLDSINAEVCYTSWDILLLTDRSENDIRDVFIFVENDSELIVQEIPFEELSAFDGEAPKLGTILLNRGDISENALKALLQKQKRLGELILENKAASSEAVDDALKEQNFIKTVNEKRTEKAGTASLRVSSDKLDELVNLVGELVTVHAQIDRESNGANTELRSMVEQLGRITENLRENTMSMRLLPIGTTFSRFKRLVRDLSNEMGKSINLVMAGEETELDKTVIEKLNDPLVHIIRNSVDHGIETPEERVKKGKPAEGMVKLTAEHAGASVRITIEDDGGGLNKEKIFKKAVQNHLIESDAVLSDEELYAMIFAAGFSTATRVTSVSGRGVGMDVVRRQIESLNGNIRVESRENEYTKIILSLPLTLAIIDGFLVNIGEDSYIFPLSVVEACIESRYEERINTGKKMVPYRETMLPYVDLREEFDDDSQRPEIDQIVVVNSDNRQIGFCVDRVVGEHQTVIKSLSGVFKNADGFSGATILGDGSVALILDTEGIIKRSVLRNEALRNESRY